MLRGLCQKTSVNNKPVPPANPSGFCSELMQPSHLSWDAPSEALLYGCLYIHLPANTTFPHGQAVLQMGKMCCACDYDRWHADFCCVSSTSLEGRFKSFTYFSAILADWNPFAWRLYVLRFLMDVFPLKCWIFSFKFRVFYIFLHLWGRLFRFFGEQFKGLIIHSVLWHNSFI